MKSVNLLLLLCVLPCACAHKAPLPPLPGFPPVEQEQAAMAAPADAVQDSTAPVNGDTPVSEQDIRELEDEAGAGAEIFVSSAPPEAPPPVNLGGNGKLTLVRHDTGEKLTVQYRNKKGEYDQAALAKINHIMRCSLDNKETAVAVKLVELLDAVEDKFGKKGLRLLSGYRTAELNGTIKGAAEHSLHMLGWAADIRIPGFSSTKVKTYAQKLRAGGVGYYPSKGFTHLDVGKPRYWVVKRAPRRRRVARRKVPVKSVIRAKKGGKPGKAPAKKASRKTKKK